MRRRFTRKSLERFMPGEEVGAAVAAAEPVELPVLNFDKEDIEIPAFLRRRS